MTIPDAAQSGTWMLDGGNLGKSICLWNAKASDGLMNHFHHFYYSGTSFEAIEPDHCIEYELTGASSERSKVSDFWESVIGG